MGDCLDYKILKKKSKPIPIDRSRRAEKEHVGLYTAKLVLSEKIQIENEHFPCMYSPLANLKIFLTNRFRDGKR